MNVTNNLNRNTCSLQGNARTTKAAENKFHNFLSASANKTVTGNQDSIQLSKAGLAATKTEAIETQSNASGTTELTAEDIDYLRKKYSNRLNNTPCPEYFDVEDDLLKELEQMGVITQKERKLASTGYIEPPKYTKDGTLITEEYIDEHSFTDSSGLRLFGGEIEYWGDDETCGGQFPKTPALRFDYFAKMKGGYFIDGVSKTRIEDNVESLNKLSDILKKII